MKSNKLCHILFKLQLLHVQRLCPIINLKKPNCNGRVACRPAALRRSVPPRAAPCRTGLQLAALTLPANTI